MYDCVVNLIRTTKLGLNVPAQYSLPEHQTAAGMAERYFGCMMSGTDIASQPFRAAMICYRTCRVHKIRF